MTTRDVDRLLTTWLDADAPVREPDHLLGEVLARTSRTRRRPGWVFPERWIPMATFMSRATPSPRVPWRFVAVALMVLALVAGTLLVIGGGRRPLPPPFGRAVNGSVAYATDGDIFTVDPATGRTTAVVSGPEVDRDPVWSLDGSRLAFVRADADGEGGRLYTARADGSDVRMLTPDASTSISSYAFSPNGKELVFGSGLGSDRVISIAKIDGTGVRTLPLPFPAKDPAFRPPDGRQIAFSGFPYDGDLVAGLYLVDADGSHFQVLSRASSEANAGRPKWSPDGASIAYSVVDLTVQEWTVATHILHPASKTDRTLPAPGSYWDSNEAWSNDGRSLATVRGYSQYGGQDAVVVVLPADGSSAGVETPRGAFAGLEPGGLIWSPDDTSLLVLPQAPNGRPLQPLLVDPRTGSIEPASRSGASAPSWQRNG